MLCNIFFHEKCISQTHEIAAENSPSRIKKHIKNPLVILCNDVERKKKLLAILTTRHKI